ncbi:hypothetical protein PRUPE_6G253600 [Prunus persica]|uniref:Uncharacterized protein n=1 Tax=Prunus persica TaxID=3760 RepID=A0A251NX69_PRUPE|nr:hypothetical protein PRUPE_6G253600 [Prunus persica]
MAHQDEGWPLGLRPLNARVGLIRSRDFSAGSVSFSTLSTGSFFHDKSITLGSLLGVSGIIGLSRRSTRRRAVETSKGHFLEVERRASNNNINRRNHGGPIEYGTDNFSPAVPVSDPNRLFVDGLVAAGQPSSSHRADGGARSNRKLLESGNGFGTPLVSSCLCGQLVK